MTSARSRSDDRPLRTADPRLIDSSDPVVVFTGLARWSVPRFSDECWLELRSGGWLFRTRYPRRVRTSASHYAHGCDPASQRSVRTPIRVASTEHDGACEGDIVHVWTAHRQPGHAEREIAAELVERATRATEERARRDAFDHADANGLQLRSSARTVDEIDAVIDQLARTRLTDPHGMALLREHRREQCERQAELLAYLDRFAATAGVAAP